MSEKSEDRKATFRMLTKMLEVYAEVGPVEGLSPRWCKGVGKRSQVDALQTEDEDQRLNDEGRDVEMQKTRKMQRETTNAASVTGYRC